MVTTNIVRLPRKFCTSFIVANAHCYLQCSDLVKALAYQERHPEFQLYGWNGASYVRVC